MAERTEISWAHSTFNPWIGCTRVSPGCANCVWLGITVVNQEEADRDIPKLLKTRANVRWLSCEPLLGPVDLGGEYLAVDGRYPFPGLPAEHRTKFIDLLDWVIVGGESGPGARPMDARWARELRDQCAAAGVPFHFKQWGEFNPEGRRTGKRASGHLLDGVAIRDFPAEQSSEGRSP